jgi:hypothetical protein
MLIFSVGCIDEVILFGERLLHSISNPVFSGKGLQHWKTDLLLWNSTVGLGVLVVFYKSIASLI